MDIFIPVTLWFHIIINRIMQRCVDLTQKADTINQFSAGRKHWLICAFVSQGGSWDFVVGTVELKQPQQKSDGVLKQLHRFPLNSTQ